jgi:hypothetical protein
MTPCSPTTRYRHSRFCGLSATPRRKHLVGLLLATAIVPCWAQNTAPSFATKLAACQRAFDAKKFKEAKECGLELQKGYRTRWQVYRLLGNVDLANGETGQAATDLRTAIAIAPDGEAAGLRALLEQAEATGSKKTEARPQTIGNVVPPPPGRPTQPEPPAEFGPSLEETLMWIANNTSALQVSGTGGSIEANGYSGRRKVAIQWEAINVASCYPEFYLRTQDETSLYDDHFKLFNHIGGPSGAKVKIPLAKVASVTVSSSTLGENFPDGKSYTWQGSPPFFVISLTAKSAVISVENATALSGIGFVTNSSELANGMRKAFLRAAELCRAKEPF